MVKRILVCLLTIAALATFAAAQVAGDYHSVASGNWDATTTWETFDGAIWSAATVKPGASNNVYIDSAFTVTLTGTEECANLNVKRVTTSTTLLAVGSNTLSVHGNIRCYRGVVPGTDTTGVGQYCITTIGGGWVSFVGTSRNITEVGTWANNPQNWRVEFKPDFGNEFILRTGFKAGNITVAQGTVTSYATSMRADSGAAGTGSLTVKAGATLHFARASTAIQRTSSAGANSQFSNLTVEANGTLAFDSSGVVIGAATLNLAGTVTYQGFVNQTLAIKGGNTNASDPNNYTILRLNGGGVKTLGCHTTVTGQLWRSAYDTVSAGAFTLTYGPDARLYYNGMVDQYVGPEWPNVNGPPDVAVYMADSTCSVKMTGSGKSYNVSRQLFLLRGRVLTSLYDTISVLSDSSVYRSGTGGDAYIYGNLAMHVSSGAVSKVFPVGGGTYLANENNYSPVTVDFNNVTSPGMLTIAVKVQYEPHVIMTDSVLGRYWVINSDGALAFDHYDATFRYSSIDFTTSFPEDPYENTMIGGKYSNYWTIPTVGTRTAGGTADGGAIKLTDLTSFSNFTFGKNVATFDSTHPQITGTSPAYGANGVALEEPIVVAFSEPMNTISLDLSIYPLLSNWNTSWNATLDTMTFTHTGIGAFDYNTIYTFHINAGYDMVGNYLAVMPDSFMFTTIANVGPSIAVVTQPSDTYFGTGPFIVRAVITDPAKVGIVADTLWYTDEMTDWWFVAHTSVSADTFNYAIPGPIAQGSVIEYFVGAYDDAGGMNWSGASEFLGNQFKVLNALPPTNLTATAGNNQVTLSWKAPAETLGYAVSNATGFLFSAGDIVDTRFSPLHYPFKLEQVSSSWWHSIGVDSVDVHVWPDNGLGLPDTTVDLIPPLAVLPLDYPTYTVVDLSGYNIVRSSGDIHVGYRIRTDNKPEPLCDGDGPGLRSLVFTSATGHWGNMSVGSNYHDWSHRAVISYSSYIKGAGKNFHCYDVLRGDASGGPYGYSLGYPSDTSVVDAGAVNGNTYYYVVYAHYWPTDTAACSNEASATPTGVAGKPEGGVPTVFSLAGTRPNPVLTSTSIRFGLPKASDIRVELYNIVGQKVRTLVNGTLEAGYHQVAWNGKNEAGQKVAAGVYLVRMVTPGFNATRKMTVLR